jgi:hypothetical protein
MDPLPEGTTVTTAPGTEGGRLWLTTGMGLASQRPGTQPSALDTLPWAHDADAPRRAHTAAVRAKKRRINECRAV